MRIVWGLKDFAFRRQELARWQAAFPNAQTTTFDDIGHFVPEELGPRLCSIVTEFMEA
jgi:pimeloyl-ACP methyl ester carboxylesterase